MFNRNLWQRLRHVATRRIFNPKLPDILGQTTRVHRRKYHRHDLSGLELAYALIGEQAFRILNMSYSGLLIGRVSLEEFGGLVQKGKHLQITISIMGISSKISVRVVAHNKTMASLRFERVQGVEEQFLNSFLFYMDSGLLLKGLPKQNVGELYQNPSWQSYGSVKGAIEVHLHLNSKSEVVEAHIFYLNGLRQDCALFSSRGINVTSIPISELNSRDRREILTHVLCIMLGLRQVGRTDRLDQFIQVGLNKLPKPLQKAS